MDNCPKKDCHEPNALIFRKVVIPASVADDRVNPPKNGDYCNMLVEYAASGNVYIFSSDGIPTMVSVDTGSIDYAELLNKPKINSVELVGDKSLGDLGITDAINDAVSDEADIRSTADQEIWTEIEAIEAGSDVVDIVGTYAELQQYDTSTLQNNDVIKVLTDETHGNAISYYRWNATTQTFTYVGSEGPYYTASETDTLLAAKQDKLIAGSNIQIAADGKTISATDTTYTHFTGATASADGTQGLVPAPVTGDQTKFLSGDGTWQTIQSSPTYTAGNGIDITNDVISADTTVVATQTDLAGKQDTLTAGTNVQINNNVISATDTTYSNFVGTDGTAPGAAGLVPAPAVADDNKYLKSDGTWATVQSGGSAMTTYYMDLDAGDDSLYSDTAMTTAVSAADVASACANGLVVIYDSYSARFLTVLDCGYAGNPTQHVGFLLYLGDNDEATSVHLDYATPSSTSYTLTLLNLQPKLTAGSNISIGTVGGVENTISVTGMPVLYGSQGQNTDGAVTQKVFTDTVGDVESILQILNSGAGV